MEKKRIISVVVPCYNESGNLRELHSRLSAVFQNLSYELELVFVDDGSTDNSCVIYDSLVAADKRVRVVMMSRNFRGPEPIMLAGMRQANGAAVVLLDADLQDPPELIVDFIKKWEEGFKVVYGIRGKREGSLIRRVCYRCFYRILKHLSFIDFPLDAGAFGLMDRRVVDVIIALPEKDVDIRGLRAWAGFKQTGVRYDRPDREHGSTTFSLFRYMRTAKGLITNFSYKPLEYVSAIAICAAFVTALASCFYLYFAFTSDAPRGFFTLLMAMLFFGTLQLVVIGVVAEYLIRIFREIKARPPYIIDRVFGGEKREES